MKFNKSRLMILASILLLCLTFFFPIWKIDLIAPQYPEGIGIRIWLNKITGVNEYDLENINKLNHYIGMKTIQPNSIPELKVMPFIVVFFVLLGILVFMINKKILTASWIILLLITLSIGLYDFYLWEYDYGHNLSPDAPIKVPGMSYQPPFIGTKQLLNMKATSLPDTGSYLIGMAAVFSLLSLFVKKDNLKLLVSTAALFLFVSCKQSPEPINYHNEDCSNCQMTISDNRFGAELITKKGKVFKFDSIECLVSYYHNFQNQDVQSMWVTDFYNPPELINIKDAFFLRSSEIQSPMGLNFAAFSHLNNLNEFKSKYGGEKLDWEDLINIVKNEWK